jgi:hypothetical protein
MDEWIVLRTFNLWFNYDKMFNSIFKLSYIIIKNDDERKEKRLNISSETNNIYICEEIKNYLDKFI